MVLLLRAWRTFVAAWQGSHLALWVASSGFGVCSLVFLFYFYLCFVHFHFLYIVLCMFRAWDGLLGFLGFV